jgi:hypothetical protein
MAYYRLYHLQNGRTRTFDEIDAADDESAVRMAEGLRRNRAAEQWCGGQKIACLPASVARES